MRNALIMVTLLVAVFVLPGLQRLDAAPKYTKLYWEGEDAGGQENNKAFKSKKYSEDASSKVSGKKVLSIDKVKPGEKVPKDSVTYKVKVPKSGVYFLWARVYWSTGCGNSFLLKVEGYDSSEWILGGDATYDCLHWICLNDGGKNDSRPRPLKLTKGTVTFTLSSREGGVMVDEFLLTDDKDFEPQGAYTPSPDALEKEKPKENK